MVRRLGGGAGLSAAVRKLSRALYAHPRGRLGLLLGPAVFWLLVFYLVALFLLLLTSLWQQDVFTAELVRKWTLSNYDKLFTGESGLWLRVFLRTVGLAAVLLRNVLERRRELALLGATGYRRGHIFAIIVAENALLLGWGLAAGALCAGVAIAPVVLERGGRLPAAAGTALLLVAVFAAGLLSSIVATRAALRAPSARPQA